MLKIPCQCYILDPFKYAMGNGKIVNQSQTKQKSTKYLKQRTKISNPIFKIFTFRNISKAQKNLTNLQNFKLKKERKWVFKYRINRCCPHSKQPSAYRLHPYIRSPAASSRLPPVSHHSIDHVFKVFININIFNEFFISCSLLAHCALFYCSLL